MRKTISSLALAIASSLAHGTQINEYFLCQPDSYEVRSNTSFTQEINNDCKKQKNLDGCAALRAEKNNLTADGGKYIYRTNDDDEKSTFAIALSISRTNGEFIYRTDQIWPDGDYITRTHKGACTPQKETLKY